MNIAFNFKTQLVSFLDELIEQFPSRSDFIIMRIFVKDQINIHDILDQFVKDVLPMSTLIKDRDEKFFETTEIVCYPKKPKFFRDFWFSDFLDKDDRDTIWRWMDVFVLLAQRYEKNKK